MNRLIIYENDGWDDNAAADDEHDYNDDDEHDYDQDDDDNGDYDQKDQDDDEKRDHDDDDNLNCLENGEHGKGVEALANDCHHIWVVSICPYVVLLVIVKCFSW